MPAQSTRRRGETEWGEPLESEINARTHKESGRAEWVEGKGETCTPMRGQFTVSVDVRAPASTYLVRAHTCTRTA